MYKEMASPKGYTPGSIAGLLNEDSTETTANKTLKKLFSSPQVSCSIIKKTPGSRKKRKQDETSVVSDDEKKIKLKKLKMLAKKSKMEFDSSPTATKSPTDDVDMSPPGENHLPEDVIDRKPLTKRKQKREKLKRIKLRDKEQNKRCVFIGNLPNTVVKKSIKKMLKVYGKVESLRFRSAAPANPKMPKKGAVAKRELNANVSTFNAYAVFAEETSAQKAVALNGEDVEGHHIRVDYMGKEAKHNHRKSIFVGNIPFDAEEEDLRQHFSECGEIDNVRLIREKFSRLGKGFGYVLFEDTDSVMLALKLNGEKFKDRKLRVERSSDPSKSQKKLKKKNGPPENKLRRSNANDKGNAAKKPKKEKPSGHSSGSKLIPASKRKEQKKKKLQHRLERKKKKKIANILSNKTSKTTTKKPRKEAKVKAKKTKDYVKEPRHRNSEGKR